MCGIAGIVGRLSPSNEAALRRMAAAIAHRGPDGEGFWHGEPDPSGRTCLLAHRRLSILDLSDRAAQPMVDPVTGKAITFNGEIYNFHELREQLGADARDLQSTGDTAVLLRMLSLRGERALAKLRGMFAFGLWDDARGELTLARDPLGIKPLYVCRNPDARTGEWSIVFASELRAILASGLLGKARLDPAASASIAWNGFVAGPGTAVQGVESLWPGQAKVFDRIGREVRSDFFWSMPRGDVQKVQTDDEVAQALRDSVRLHMISDVPVAVFLSGGIDSSAVANLAQQQSEGQVNTFTLAFEEPEWNEGIHSRQIAEAIGARHHEVVLTEQRFVDQFESALDAIDQPTFDGLNSYYVSRAVREAGLKVALIGTGGDELFGGYNTFRDLPLFHRLSSSSAWMPEVLKVTAARAVAALAARSRGAVAPQTRWAKLPGMVEDGRNIVALYQHAYALFLPAFQRELLAGRSAYLPLFRGLSEQMYTRLATEIEGHSALSALSVLETRLFLGERLLRDSDAASMAVSLELRLPLVDAPLLQAVNRVDDRWRYAPVGRKQMLRRIGLAGLDPALFERPKRGFVLPFDQWIRQRLGREMDEVMRDERAIAATGLDGRAVTRLWDAYQQRSAGLYWSRVWALYIFVRWCHRHGVLL